MFLRLYCNMIQFFLFPIFGSYWIVACLALVFFFSFLWIRPSSERLTRPKRRILEIIRFVALLLLIFAFLRPTIVLKEVIPLASTVYFLIDQSESMSRPDEFGGKTRFQVATESLKNVESDVKYLQQKSDVQAFLFDAALHQLDLKDGMFQKLPELPLGKETAIGLALDDIRERASGKRVLGTILLSDGTQRTRFQRDISPNDAAVRLRDAGIPLFSVRFGQPSGTPDIQDVAINEIIANQQVFVKNKFLISGTIRIAGFQNQPIPVQLLWEDENGKMKLVDETTVQSAGDGQSVQYHLSFIPESPGQFKYTVFVPPLPKELIDTNNQQSQFVRVIDGGLNVLYIQGERNFEQGPLMQSLNASPDIQVMYLPIRVGKIGIGTGGNRGTGNRSNSFEKRLEQYTAERDSWVKTEFVPEKYNVFILDDIDSKAFKSEELEALAERVKEGAGLIMLGGLHAFGAGGYAETPLAAIAPIELSSLDKQPFDAPIRKDIHWPESVPIPMQMTDEGRRHYVMRLNSDLVKNREIWSKLPPLNGANMFGKLKPGSTLLAEGPNQQKLLVWHLFGLGRVLAFAGDSTFQWPLAGFLEEHKLFWRQIVLWLAKMESLSEGDCWIALDQTRLMPGETATFRVMAKNADGDLMQNFKASATIMRPNGESIPVSLTDDDGTPNGTFRGTDLPGDYSISVTILGTNEGADSPAKRATCRFMVQDRNLELENPVAYPKLLETMSAETGGRSLAPEQLKTLLNELQEKADTFVESRETKKSLYDSWILMCSFILLLSCEWFLRKKWGLV
ncbi:MAG: VWA domain-containing protein [Thermoguttaceae bacterium]